MRFRDYSIRRKLMILMMVASSIALTLMCVALLSYDVVTAKQATAARLYSLGAIIRDNSKAALSFSDQTAATEVLSTLRAEPHITAACIYDVQGKPFAVYRASGNKNYTLPPLRPAGSYFDSDRIAQYLPMALGSDQIGVVYIESDLGEISARYRRYATILLVVMAASWLASLLIGSRLQRTITDPLHHLIEIARAIGDSGDLNQHIDVDRKDEIGDLANSFSKMIAYLKEMAIASKGIAGGDLSREVTPRSEQDTLGHAFVLMTKGLRGLVQSVREGSAQLAGASLGVASTSGDSAKVSVESSSAIDEVTSTMQEMHTSLQNVVKNTQMQASSVAETSTSIDEMVTSIQRVADTGRQLLDISNRSREEVQSGITSMQKVEDGLGRINTSIESASHTIGVLGGRAQDIGKIIEVIEDLADQTNLLALNAAIEAARAGEHGLGFSVVAEEVRKLAEKSAQSTKEISELIQGIQKESVSATVNMEKSAEIVNDSLHLGAELGVALRKISNVVTEVYTVAKEISAATSEQSNGSSQIAKSTTRLNEITHEIESSVEEQSYGTAAVVKAMERMRELVQRSSSGSTELAASAAQMSRMAQDMTQAVDQFKLEAHSEPPSKLSRAASR